MDLLETLKSLRPNEVVVVDFGKEATIANLVWMSQRTFLPEEITTVSISKTEYSNISDTSGYTLEGDVYVKKITTRSNVPVYESNVITISEDEYSNLLFDRSEFVHNGNVYVKTTQINIGPPLEGGNVVIWNEESNVFTESPFTIPTTKECLEHWNSTVKLPTLLTRIRKKRNTLLSKTDYLATIDYPHPSPEAKQAWLDYRQALRDLPANTVDPENPVWPEAPNS